MSAQTDWSHTRRGFSLVEIILATTLFAIVFTAIMTLFVYEQETTSVAHTKGQAALIAKEGIDAVASIRNMQTTLPDDGTYGLDTTVSPWQLTSSPDINGIYTRSITVETVDDTTKKVTVTVFWNGITRLNSNMTFITYLTNWRATINRP